MGNFTDLNLENKLIAFIDDFTDIDVCLEKGEYQKLVVRIYDKNKMKALMKAGSFKDIGSMYDYSDYFDIPEYINAEEISKGFDFFNRIAVSKKYNAIMHYDRMYYSIECTILVDKENVKKFAKKLQPVFQNDTTANLFQNVSFTSNKKKEYYEVANNTGIKGKNKEYDDDGGDQRVIIRKRKVEDESLVFTTDSEIFNVMQDIKTFFEPKTKKLYDKMHIVYKRGVIIYGDPGNGKSAMIREIIRQVPGILKVVINPNIENVTNILTELVEQIKGHKAIIIIEDIDSLITSHNRSEFLNILDGINATSGIYFVGTTNYPDRIDPAFMNRSGRFDRTYKIDNPSDVVRKAFFRDRDIADLLSPFKVHKEGSENTDLNIVDLFVKYSDNMSMANLKELMLSTQYSLATNKEHTIEDALINVHDMLTKTRSDHVNEHNKFNEREYYRGFRPRERFVD